ncbi:hypothetical protein F4809DRAFT_603004 [Biscogniauxia mediterranea]|nr:hypothetical protein F4809DRAFT_603004 [Biscogniauxia mediterranea]
MTLLPPISQGGDRPAGPPASNQASPRGGGGAVGRDTGTGTPRAKRVQVSRACPRCRRLQKACSDSRPCPRCTKAGLAKECGGLTIPSQPPLATPNADAHPETASAASPVPVASSPFASLDMPTTPHAFTSFARELFQRQVDLLPPQVLEHCSARFFERLSPTIPILSPEYVMNLRTRASPSEAGSEPYCVLVSLCAMVMLQVEDPSGNLFGDLVKADSNAAYGWLLLEEALAAHRHLTRKSTPSLDHVLLLFFIYACHARLSHHSQAFFFIREATTLFLLVKPENLDKEAQELAGHLYWILLISERSHAIRYRRPITLQVSPGSSFSLPSTDHNDPSLIGLCCLAKLFRPLDSSFIALLNQETVSICLGPEALNGVEMGINTALDHPSITILQATQKANLRVTQLWLRVVLWQLRLRLGHLDEKNIINSRTYHYPLEIAKDLMLSTCDLPPDSIQVHGNGITEKFFDIACVVVNVLSRVPLEMARTAAEDNLEYIRRLIRQLPGGLAVYDALLIKHIQQTLPSMATRLSS